MNNSSIEWTDVTWNPLRGCTRVSEGCRSCYAERIAARFSGPGQPFEGVAERTAAGPRWTGKVKLIPEALQEPLHMRKPKRIFVNSMSDLFHEAVPMGFVMQVLAIAALCPQHTFQILTKRPERMHAALTARGVRDWCFASARQVLADRSAQGTNDIRALFWSSPEWPLPNVHLGVSVENQETLWRIDRLRQTPAAVRFLSSEPLLEDLGQIDLSGIHWVIVGGESGPGARPMHPDWVRSIRDQCQASGTHFFFKQWGEWAPHGQSPVVPYAPAGDIVFSRLGKRAAGRTLDGRTWEERPR